MNVFRIEVRNRAAGPDDSDITLVTRLREVGLSAIAQAWTFRLFFLDGELPRADAERIASGLLADPVTEVTFVHGVGEAIPPRAGIQSVEILLKPGVMDPVAESTLAELKSEGYAVAHVRTGRRIEAQGPVDGAQLLAACRRFLASDVIEDVVPGTFGIRPAPKPPIFEFELRHVEIRELDDAALETLSRRGHLFLSLDEMRAIQAHFRGLNREPTDLELETLAQTWSEHCVHKTLKSAVVYRGAAMPTNAPRSSTEYVEARPTRGASVELRYSNLLKDTIVRATRELMEAGAGPTCLSVFKDNAGVIAFDDDFGVAFKVETHNRPSAIEPYGGAATGIGGCIRDVLGCGLGARPIANTDVFCVAPTDWPLDQVPKGVLHPGIVLRGVVDGVGDYGNRMGIPTVNGSVCFDPRYLGNPLVFCGCAGLIPRDKIEKAARPGDLIVLVGGRTGRDGIHGATFSSAELTDSHADEFSHAVQIGNAITEKRVLDAIVRARDDAERSPSAVRQPCLYSAITDCGAGGLSSAIGEMAAEIGATVDLEKVPLKYAGLRYDEIWISEAQERMVLSVPPETLDTLLRIMREEEVEASVIGVFGTDRGARLVTRFNGAVVGDLDMQFVHDGLPRRERVAEWQPTAISADATSAGESSEPIAGNTSIADRLLAGLRAPSTAGKEWIIRRYDHEVQGGSVIKPLCGPGAGPADAAVLRPRLDSTRGIAIGCGLAPEISDIDPYWMAMAAIDEALNNVACVGGDPAQTAILDNFCWGRCDDPRQMGGIVRACQACYDAAVAWKTPFISGKDSLNNEFALDPGDVEAFLAVMRRYMAIDTGDRDGAAARLAATEQRIRAARRLSIPGTLLISAMALVDDAARCVTPDFKRAGGPVFLVGGLPRVGFDIAEADRTRRAIAHAIQAGWVAACHDCSSGWAVAAAEMSIGADRGAELFDTHVKIDPLTPLAAGFVVELAAAPDGAHPAEHTLRFMDLVAGRNVRIRPLGSVADDQASGHFTVLRQTLAVAALRAAWRRS